MTFLTHLLILFQFLFKCFNLFAVEALTQERVRNGPWIMMWVKSMTNQNQLVLPGPGLTLTLIWCGREAIARGKSLITSHNDNKFLLPHTTYLIITLIPQHLC